MSNKKYLPVWTDDLTYDEQHLTYWIANNMERVDQRYSFLPVRMLGDFFCERKRFNYTHLIADYFEKGRVRVSCEIIPLAYYVAEKAFDAAANAFFAQYPDATNVTFSKVNFNGIYDAKFDMGYSDRLSAFKEILDKKIDAFSVIDEEFVYKKEKQGEYSPWPEYSLTAKLDLNEDVLYYDFPEILCSAGFPYVPKKQVAVRKEDVCAYYYTIPEKVFVLSNQYMKYEQNEKELTDFFDAARKRDLAMIKKFVSAGTDINGIDKEGRTAFGHMVGSIWDEKEACPVETLQEMIKMGANPAIYGAGFDEDLLSDECLNAHFEVVRFLLESGVNPHIYLCIDEPGEVLTETLLERTERWAVGDPNVDGKPGKEQAAILALLRKYA